MHKLDNNKSVPDFPQDHDLGDSLMQLAALKIRCKVCFSFCRPKLAVQYMSALQEEVLAWSGPWVLGQLQRNPEPQFTAHALFKIAVTNSAA